MLGLCNVLRSECVCVRVCVQRGSKDAFRRRARATWALSHKEKHMRVLPKTYYTHCTVEKANWFYVSFCLYRFSFQLVLGFSFPFRFHTLPVGACMLLCALLFIFFSSFLHLFVLFFWFPRKFPYCQLECSTIWIESGSCNCNNRKPV